MKTDVEKQRLSNEIGQAVRSPGGQMIHKMIIEMIDSYVQRFMDPRTEAKMREFYAGGARFGEELLAQLEQDISLGRLYAERAKASATSFVEGRTVKKARIEQRQDRVRPPETSQV